MADGERFLLRQNHASAILICFKSATQRKKKVFSVFYLFLSNDAHFIA